MLGAATANLFRASRLSDFCTGWNWYSKVWDEQTVIALGVFHVLFSFLFLVSWILFIGREQVYKTEILPWIRPEPPRPFLERVRRRWG